MATKKKAPVPNDGAKMMKVGKTTESASSAKSKNPAKQDPVATTGKKGAKAKDKAASSTRATKADSKKLTTDSLSSDATLHPATKRLVKKSQEPESVVAKKKQDAKDVGTGSQTIEDAEDAVMAVAVLDPSKINRGFFPTVKKIVPHVEEVFVPEEDNEFSSSESFLSSLDGNPFLSLINPSAYQEKMKTAKNLGKEKGVFFTPIDSSPLHQPKRTFIARSRDINGDFKPIHSPEYALRLLGSAEDEFEEKNDQK